MKRSIYLITILLQALLILVSCDKTIEFKGDTINPKITINGIINPSEFVSVNVSKSYFVQDENWDRDKIANAKAELFENDVLIETLKSKPTTISQSNFQIPSNETNFYSETVKPQPSKTYRIEVSSPNLTKAIGTTSIPSKVEIIKIDTIRNTSNNNGYIYSDLTVNLTLKDIPNETNYYKINVYIVTGKNSTKLGTIKQMDSIILSTQKFNFDFSKDPILNPQGESTDLIVISDSKIQNLFADEFIRNKEYTLKLAVPFNSFHNESIDTLLNEFELLTIEIETLHPDYYNYIKSAILQSESRNNPFTEPVLDFTNISNGLGIFSSKETASRNFLIGKYPVEGVTYTKFDPYNF